MYSENFVETYSFDPLAVELSLNESVSELEKWIEQIGEITKINREVLDLEIIV